MTDLIVDLWVWDLDRSQISDAREILSIDEMARADRFVADIHAHRFEQGRAGLRKILADYLALEPEQLAFEYGSNGKPSISGPFQFNLSHTENWAAVAVVKNVQIGLDIQRYRKVEADVANRFFSSAEVAELSTLPPEHWNDGFYRCWTRKEAIVKGLGAGLSVGLDGFDVSLLPGKPAVITRFEKSPEVVKNWSLHHFDLAQDLVGAIAVENQGKSVKINRKTSFF